MPKYGILSDSLSLKQSNKKVFRNRFSKDAVILICYFNDCLFYRLKYCKPNFYKIVIKTLIVRV